MKKPSAAYGDGHAPYHLMRKIVALSTANDWHGAKDEWRLEVVWLEPRGVCLCGHAPITEQCLIRNCINGNAAVVGNICVKRFLGLPSDDIFKGFQRIRRNLTAALAVAAARYAYARGWLNDWEIGFCLNTVQRRTVSARERAKKVEINGRLLTCLAAVCHQR